MGNFYPQILNLIRKKFGC